MTNVHAQDTAARHAEDLARLELYDENSRLIGVIEDRPGQQLSLRIYYQIAQDSGVIGPQAARRALELYGAHAADAQANPGKHPNIDRLFRIVADNLRLTIVPVFRD